MKSNAVCISQQGKFGNQRRCNAGGILFAVGATSFGRVSRRQFAGELFKKPKPFSNDIVAKAPLIKKKAFEYEHEVRLLFFHEKLQGAIENLFCYPVDPHKLIEQIMIDPQITRQCYRHLKKYIHETTGFPEDKIKQSRIYDPPLGTQQYSQKGEPIKI